MKVQRMADPVRADLSELADLIESAHQQGVSNCIHFNDPIRRAGRILIKEGKIIFISFNSIRGVDALAEIRKLPSVSYRVARFLPMPKDRHLPDTQTILQELSGRASSPINQKAVEKKTAPLGKGLSAEEKQVVNDILNDIVGPMADFLIEDYVVGANNLNEVIANLSVELSRDDLAIFRSELKQLL